LTNQALSVRKGEMWNSHWHHITVL